MAEPDLVAECVAKMQHAVAIPVTVKSRIGIDNKDSYEELVHFIRTIANAGCSTFIIHARKAWLSGLSPKENREIPSLRYDTVYQLKIDFPHLEIILNGGVTSIDQAETILNQVDGVMVGREAYQNPYLLAQVDHQLYGDVQANARRTEIIHALLPYIGEQLAAGNRLHSVMRHTLGLFHGEYGARGWRRYISENANKTDADEAVVLEALKFTVPDVY
jgi:tRNA-dihydrouridine synthase A